MQLKKRKGLSHRSFFPLRCHFSSTLKHTVGINSYLVKKTITKQTTLMVLKQKKQPYMTP